jgi:MFS family permease
LAAGIGVATGLALFAYIASLFIRQYVADFNWTRGQIGLSAFATLAAGFSAPVIGRIADRHGVRTTIAVCTVGFGAVCIGMANQVGVLWHYYLLYFLLVAFGLGAGSVTWTRMISAAFEQSRGLALSVGLSLVTFTAMVMPPLLQSTIAAQGWRAGWLLIGALAVGAGAIALLIAPQRDPAPSRQALGVESLKRAARIPAFWLAVIGMYLINIPSGGLMNQMEPLLSDRQFAPTQAALIMSAFAAAVFVGRLVAGACLDHFPTRFVAFVSMALPAAGCLMLAGQAGGAFVLVAVGIALAGLSQGAEGDIAPYLVARRFGMAAFGGLLGALNTATVAGTATGSILFTQAHDRTGSYDVALYVGAVCFLAGALCYLAIGNGAAGQKGA